MLNTINPADLHVAFSFDSAKLGDRPVLQRRLADLKGSFADNTAYEAALAEGNPLLYEVTAVEPASGDGQLHYGLGILYPGKIGGEYYLTKGHYHSHRPAAEVYVGLSGEGMMLLEDEETGESVMTPLCANQVVYVPGHTAHRTVNTGGVPLVYLGIYPSNAGHDYGSIAVRNFRKIIVERDGKPVCLDRPSL
jgi:glucose-6-phosphate isomerase